MSPLDSPIGVTFFRDAVAKSLQQESLSMRELAARIAVTTAASKTALPWLKLALFGEHRTAKGSLRNNANLLFLTGIEADYDLEQIQPETARDLLHTAGIAGLVYTSPSHTAERPRWRVLCPVSEWLCAQERRTLVAKLNGILGGVLSVESFTPSQAYYLGRVGNNPAHATWLVDGTYIDEARDLCEVYPKISRPIAVPAMPAGTPPTGRLAAACDLFKRGEPRHQTLNAAALMVAPLILSGHLVDSDVVAALSAAMSESGREPNDGEVESSLTGALPISSPFVDGSEFESVAPSATVAQPEVVFREITENEAARLFARRYADRFKFDVNAGGNGRGDTGAWVTFRDGIGWDLDETSSVTDQARTFVELARKQWGYEKSEKAGSIGFATAVVRGCQTDPLMVVTRAVWDTNPYDMGVPGGHVDLRTGEFHAARRDILIRRRTAVSPAPVGTISALWSRFLDETTAGDRDLQAWLQRFVGYCLTGDTSEEMFAFVHGPGGNGKGVFLGAIMGAMGGYALDVPTDFFVSDGGLNKEAYLATMDGARLVSADETDQGKPLAESLVKQITGKTSQISARRLYGKPFTFAPQCKVMIIGNHAPTLKGRGEAMERRMRVVPFTNKPKTVDGTLKDRMAAEYPAILRWMIDGCLAWQRDRLGTCAAVDRASQAYFADQDLISLWAADRCANGPEHRGSTGALLEDFNTWLRCRGDKPVDSRAFKESAVARLPGVEWRHGRTGAFVAGLALRASTATEFDGMV